MDATFLKERIAATQTQIVAHEAAIDALATDGIKSYSMDTGQGKQDVTYHDMGRLQSSLSTLYNRLAMLEGRLYGNNSVQGRPAW